MARHRIEVGTFFYELEPIIIKMEDDSETSGISVEPMTGHMVGTPFVLCNFGVTEFTYDNGDGQVKFDVSFPNEPNKDLHDVLLADNSDTVHAVAHHILFEAIEDSNEGK